MPRRMDVDHKQLMKMIADQVPQAKIMDKFGFKTVTQLKVAMANAAMAQGKLPALVSGQAASAAPAANVIRVNKRGSLIIPKEMVDAFGLAEGQEFTMRQAKYGLQVRKLEDKA